MVKDIRDGKLKNEANRKLDNRLVVTEQRKLTELLGNLKNNDPDKYNKIIAESNATLNPGDTIRAVLPATDKAYVENVLDPVRKELGRDINFASQGDRVQIGYKLVE